MTALRRRLARLETYRPRCPRCFGHPVRMVGIHAETGAIISETYPESGCPECGTPPRSTREIVGIDVSQLFAARESTP